MRGIVQLGRRARCTASGRRATQGGFSLLEIVIAVALVSVSVLALATAFLTLVRTNAATGNQQTADHAAANYAESMKALSYQPCTTSATPDYGDDPGAWTPSSGVQVDVVDVEFWDPSTQDYVDSCPGADSGTQRITVRAEWRDRERQAQIVKRNR